MGRCHHYLRDSKLDDYNAFLAKPNLARDIGECIFEHLSIVFRRWNRFEAIAIEHFEDTIGIGPQYDFNPIHLQMLTPDLAPIIRLPDSWTRYLTALSREKRRSFEYLQRRLWREEDPVFEIYTDSHLAEEMKSISSILELKNTNCKIRILY